MKDSILITGGAGFVGSSLALLLRNDFPGARIVALDNLKRRGSELNIPRLKSAGVEFVHADVRIPEDLGRVDRVDVLIHCAAEPSFLAGYDGLPSYVINSNLCGAVNCLEIARRHKAEFIFLSTSRVYPIEPIRSLRYIEGDSRFHLKDEQVLPGVSVQGITERFPMEGFRSMYGASKLASELMIAEYMDMYGINSVINRCGTLTGPWQMGKVEQGFMVLWVAQHIYGGKLTYIGYNGTGVQVRDILHVQDLYQLLRIQMNNLPQFSGQIYNVGGGKEISTSLLELTHLCQEVTGNRITIDSESENRPGDIPWYVSDCSKVHLATGWKPHRSMSEIVEEIAVWIWEHKEDLRHILT